MKILTFTLVLAAVLALAMAEAGAQPSNLPQTVSFVFASGGETAAGGGYTFTHTLGEAIAGNSSGGNYFLSAGFLAPDAADQEQGVDLTLTASRSPIVVTENIVSVLTLSVSNQGPATANGVKLTVNLPPGLRAQSAATSMGTSAVTSSNVLCSVASLANNSFFTVDLALRANFLAGSSDLVVGLSNLAASVSGVESDRNPPDDSLALPVSVWAQTDWGDARNGFPVTAAENGAYARYSPSAPWLGARWDNETPTGVHSLLADWDDTHGASDDDDGVVFQSPIIAGARVWVLVICANAPGFLDAWADFNNNNSWADPGEQIFASQLLALGTNTLTFTVPSSAVTEAITTRWRVSATGGLSYTGYGGPGEVEDHMIPIRAASRPGLRRVAGVAQLTFQTETQVNYQVEYTDSLSAPNWKPLMRVVGTGDTVVVPDDTSSQMRFYRVRVE